MSTISDQIIHETDVCTIHILKLHEFHVSKMTIKKWWYLYKSTIFIEVICADL